MIITVTLHCQGFQTPCSSVISTGLRDATGQTPRLYPNGSVQVTVGLLAQSAKNGGWDVRPVGSDSGETWQARCPACTQRLMDWTAEQITKELDRHHTRP